MKSKTKIYNIAIICSSICAIIFLGISIWFGVAAFSEVENAAVALALPFATIFFIIFISLFGIFFIITIVLIIFKHAYKRKLKNLEKNVLENKNI